MSQQPSNAEPLAALAAVGEALRASVEEIMEAYVARLRHDPAIPLAADLDVPSLEDHASSYLVDVGTGLVAMARGGTDLTELLRDGSAVQELVSSLHGEQRGRLGWTERALSREFQILEEEVDGAVRRAARGIAQLEIGLDLVRRALARDREVSLRALRQHGG